MLYNVSVIMHEREKEQGKMTTNKKKKRERGEQYYHAKPMYIIFSLVITTVSSHCTTPGEILGIIQACSCLAAKSWLRDDRHFPLLHTLTLHETQLPVIACADPGAAAEFFSPC